MHNLAKVKQIFYSFGNSKIWRTSLNIQLVSWVIPNSFELKKIRYKEQLSGALLITLLLTFTLITHQLTPSLRCSQGAIDDPLPNKIGFATFSKYTTQVEGSVILVPLISSLSHTTLPTCNITSADDQNFTAGPMLQKYSLYSLLT